MKKRLSQVMVTALLLAAPLIGISQDPPGPGSIPEDPVVPFDDNMNLVFLTVGVLFAVFMTVRHLRKRAHQAH